MAICLYKSGFFKEDNITASQSQFVNNSVAFLFSEIRYEVNGQTIDINTKPGIPKYGIHSRISISDLSPTQVRLSQAKLDLKSALHFIVATSAILG